MNAVFKHFKKNKIIYIIIFLFLFAKLFTIPNYKIIWWDSAVYIGMGKYIYSLGKAGLWEESRPIAWPLMLGSLWKTGPNLILFGRILEIVFGSLCIPLTYLIAKKLFNKKTAILSSIFLALSPTFFFFNGIMLTEIISTLFSLAAIYFFISRRYYISGIFFGIAFMTRFLQLIVFISILLIILLYNKKNIHNISKLIIGFLIPVVPFVVLNQILYNNALYPFLQQISLSNNSGWHNFQPISYYFVELFKENFFYLLPFFGIFLTFKTKDAYKMFIATTFLLFFIFFNLIKQKEMRFLIVLLPYMYLLVSYSIIYLLNKSKSYTFKRIILVFIILSFILSIANISQYYKNESNKKNQYGFLQDKFQSQDVNGKIWVSNPIIAVYSNKKINTLMYYPYFNGEKKNELINGTVKADFIFVDSCDLACRPTDFECEKDKAELINHLKRQLKTDYYSRIDQCQQFIFRQ